MFYWSLPTFSRLNQLHALCPLLKLLTNRNHSSGRSVSIGSFENGPFLAAILNFVNSDSTSGTGKCCYGWTIWLRITMGATWGISKLRKTLLTWGSFRRFTGRGCGAGLSASRIDNRRKRLLSVSDITEPCGVIGRGFFAISFPDIMYKLILTYGDYWLTDYPSTFLPYPPELAHDKARKRHQ